jgi:hypothetical protein
LVAWLLCKGKKKLLTVCRFWKALELKFFCYPEFQNSWIQRLHFVSIGCFQWTLYSYQSHSSSPKFVMSIWVFWTSLTNWSKLSVNSESGSYNYQESIVPCKFHFPYACSIKLGVDNFIKIQVLSWMYLLYACCIKLGVYNFIKNRVPSCMYVLYACCIKVGVYNFIKNRVPSCMYVLYACCIKVGVYNFIKIQVLPRMYLLYACCIKLGVYDFIKFFQSPTYCSSYIRLKKLEPSTQENISMGKQVHQLTVNNTHSTSNSLAQANSTPQVCLRSFIGLIVAHY